MVCPVHRASPFPDLLVLVFLFLVPTVKTGLDACKSFVYLASSAIDFGFFLWI